MQINEKVKTILIIAMALSLCIINVMFAKCIIKDWIRESVKEAVYPDWTEEERQAMKRLHKYHGTCYAFQCKNGKWYYFRDNQLCELWDPKKKGGEMKVLIACEFSGIVRDAFAGRGHDVWSCDLLPTERPGNHIQGDVLEILDDGWDLMIAHPPCTYLCNSGVTWLWNKDKTKNLKRWDDMKDGSSFFLNLMNAPIRKIAIENPIMHKYSLQIIGKKYDQIIQPWMFGTGESKATCLWLKNLSKLYSTNIVDGRLQRLHRLPPSENRWKLRSTTYPNIAKAMAEQWG